MRGEDPEASHVDRHSHEAGAEFFFCKTSWEIQGLMCNPDFHAIPCLYFQDCAGGCGVPGVLVVAAAGQDCHNMAAKGWLNNSPFNSQDSWFGSPDL